MNMLRISLAAFAIALLHQSASHAQTPGYYQWESQVKVLHGDLTTEWRTIHAAGSYSVEWVYWDYLEYLWKKDLRKFGDEVTSRTVLGPHDYVIDIRLRRVFYPAYTSIGWLYQL